LNDIHTTTEHIDSSRNPGNTLSHTNLVAIDDGPTTNTFWRRGFRPDGYWHWLGRRAREITGTSNHKVSSDAAGMVMLLNVVCWGGVISTIREARPEEIHRDPEERRGGEKRAKNPKLGSPSGEG